MNPSGVGPRVRVGSGVRVGSVVRVAARAGSVGDRIENVSSASDGIRDERALFGVIVIVGVGLGIRSGVGVLSSSSDNANMELLYYRLLLIMNLI